MIKAIYTWLLIALLVAAVYFSCLAFFRIEIVHADESKFIQKSRIDNRKKIIYGADGKPKGYLQQSPIDPRKTVQYDKDGNIEGTWQKSYIDPRKTIFIKKGEH